MDGKNSNFILTPFDPLILELKQSGFRNPAHGALTSIGSLVLNQLQFLRIIYVDYLPLKIDNFDHLYFGTSGVRQLSAQEVLASSDDGIRIMLRYLSFLDVLNQFSRCLNRLDDSKNLPLHAEILFFRNKIAEHWDDGYFSLKPGGSYTRSAKKIPVPLLNGRPYLTKDIPIFEKELHDMFVNCKVPLSDLSDLHETIYSPKVYVLLKQIDPTLCNRSKNFRIPDKLIKLLFMFGFPLPIYDIEAYCSRLVIYLRTLKLMME